MLKWKIDIWNAIKEAGESSYSIAEKGKIGYQTLVYLKRGQMNVSLKTIDALCEILECQPGDLIEYVEEP